MQSFSFNLPDKPFFKPDEVVRLTRLDGRVIAYWSGEFEGIRPEPSQNGEPVYARAALERILLIKKLLVDERLDKESVRRRLKGEVSVPPPVRIGNDGILRQIKQGLMEILTILDKGDKI